VFRGRASLGDGCSALLVGALLRQGRRQALSEAVGNY